MLDIPPNSAMPKSPNIDVIQGNLRLIQSLIQDKLDAESLEEAKKVIEKVISKAEREFQERQKRMLIDGFKKIYSKGMPPLLEAAIQEVELDTRRPSTSSVDGKALMFADHGIIPRDRLKTHEEIRMERVRMLRSPGASLSTDSNASSTTKEINAEVKSHLNNLNVERQNIGNKAEVKQLGSPGQVGPLDYYMPSGMLIRRGNYTNSIKRESQESEGKAGLPTVSVNGNEESKKASCSSTKQQDNAKKRISYFRSLFFLTAFKNKRKKKVAPESEIAHQLMNEGSRRNSHCFEFFKKL